MFNVEFRCFLRLRSSKNNSNGGHLRCLSGSVRAGESRDDAGLDRTLLIVARATSAELESRVYVLGLAQETSEKNIGCVLLQRLLRDVGEDGGDRVGGHGVGRCVCVTALRESQT